MSSDFFWAKKKNSSSSERPLFSIAGSRSLKDETLFCTGNRFADLRDCIDICRYTGYAMLNKPGGHLRIRTSLTADGALDIICPAHLDCRMDEVKNCGVLGLVHIRNIFIVTVNCEGVLDEIIRPECCEFNTTLEEVLAHDRAC